MKELVERLRELRDEITLEIVFEEEPSTAEFQQNCANTIIGYSQV